MKTKVFIFCILFLVVGQLFSQTWQVLNSATANRISKLHFINSSTGYITCGGEIKRTTDGGVTWNTVLDQYFAQWSIHFVNQHIGFAVGSQGSIFKTINSGLNWSLTNPASANFTAINFTDSNTGYIVGYTSTILKTTNGGDNWFTQICPVVPGYLMDIVFCNNKGYIALNNFNTNLLFTTDAGLTWQDGKVRAGLIQGNAIIFNGETGYLVGSEYSNSSYQPLIFMTDNNGQNWHEYVLGSLGALHGVAVSPTDRNKVCVVGEYFDDSIHGNQGLIMRTSNGGETWSEEQYSVALWSVYATATDFYVGGLNGVLLKTSHTVGISVNNSEAPSCYTLSQNYPNPFNPSTKINFSILKAGAVELTVYNILGEIVSVLVNQSLRVGTYTYDFDGKNLSSGVYFYTLQSEGYIDTKSMVLLK